MAQSSVSIQMDQVVKRHGTTVALDRVSLVIEEGEFFSILGPSGSGKTTLLRLIAGLDQPDQGKIVIDGQSMNGRPPFERPVNMVFQQYALFPHLTVWQNVAFGLEMKRLSQADIRIRVEEMLQMVELLGMSDRLPGALSGGEQQRVALARALVNHPKVLLLDEPLGALDQQLRQGMQRELKRIQQQVGITFVCVTHHQEEALFLSDRVAVLAEGQVKQIGTPQELYNYPESLFVAEFVGLSNRLNGEIHGNGNQHSLFFSSGLTPFQVPDSWPDGTSRPAIFLIRPERLTLKRPDDALHTQNAVSGKIVNALYRGDEMQYQVLLPTQNTWVIREPIVSHEHTRFSPGDQVTVYWEMHEGVVLNAS